MEVRSNASDPLPISTEVARRLLGERKGTLLVYLRHELPIGQGFGLSAAGALSTSLAVAQLLDEPPHRALEVAHLADFHGGGGLGGVASILGGGMELRRRPGIPPWGEAVHRAFRPELFIALLGSPLPSPRLLRSGPFLRRVERAAASEVRRLSTEFRPSNLLDASERFTDRLQLGRPSIRRAISELRKSGAWVAQTMFGNALFASPRNSRTRRALVRELERRRLPAIALASAPEGAHLVGTPGTSAPKGLYPEPGVAPPS